MVLTTHTRLSSAVFTLLQSSSAFTHLSCAPTHRRGIRRCVPHGRPQLQKHIMLTGTPPGGPSLVQCAAQGPPRQRHRHVGSAASGHRRHVQGVPSICVQAVCRKGQPLDHNPPGKAKRGGGGKVIVAAHLWVGMTGCWSTVNCCAREKESGSSHDVENIIRVKTTIYTIILSFYFFFTMCVMQQHSAQRTTATSSTSPSGCAGAMGPSHCTGACTAATSAHAGCGRRSGHTRPLMQNCASWGESPKSPPYAHSTLPSAGTVGAPLGAVALPVNGLHRPWSTQSQMKPPCRRGWAWKASQ